MLFLLFMVCKINFDGKGNAFLAFYAFQDQLFESTMCPLCAPYVHFTLVPSSRPSQQQPTDHCFLPSAATVLCAHALRPGLHTVR